MYPFGTRNPETHSTVMRVVIRYQLVTYDPLEPADNVINVYDFPPPWAPHKP